MYVHVYIQAERIPPSETAAIRALLTGASCTFIYAIVSSSRQHYSFVRCIHVLDAVPTVAVLASSSRPPTKSFTRPAASTKEASHLACLSACLLLLAYSAHATCKRLKNSRLERLALASLSRLLS